MLRGVAAALDALRLRYQLQVCFATPQVTNSFLLTLPLPLTLTLTLALALTLTRWT